MKRFAYFIASVVLGLSLVGCGGTSAAQETSPSTDESISTYTGTVLRTGTMVGWGDGLAYNVFFVDTVELPFACSYDATCAMLKPGDNVRVTARQYTFYSWSPRYSTSIKRDVLSVFDLQLLNKR